MSAQQPFAILKGFYLNKTLTFELRNSKVLVGRDRDCEICLSGSPSVSSLHAQIEIITSGNSVSCFIQDLNSTNGTFINNAKIPQSVPISLKNRDFIRFGYDEVLYRIEYKEGGSSHTLKRTLGEEIFSLHSPLKPKDEDNKLNDVMEEVLGFAIILLAKLNSLKSLDDKTKITYEVFKELSNVRDAVNNITENTLFEADDNKKLRQLEMYNRTLEKKITDFKEELNGAEKNIENMKQEHCKSQEEIIETVHQLNRKLQITMADNESLSKQRLNDLSDFENKLKDFENLQFKLKLAESQNKDLRKSNESLKEQLLKTQEHSNYLNRELLKDKGRIIECNSNSTPRVIDTKTADEDRITYLSDKLLEKEKIIINLENEIDQLRKIVFPHNTSSLNNSNMNM
ncbi:hypothetical protein ABK040_006054 [Willaertia magna]